jgi:hypothetical protein
MANTDGDEKAPMHMRLTGTARRLMQEMAKRKGISQTAVVELAVRQMAKTEGIEAKESNPDGA